MSLCLMSRAFSFLCCRFHSSLRTHVVGAGLACWFIFVHSHTHIHDSSNIRFNRNVYVSYSVDVFVYLFHHHKDSSNLFACWLTYSLTLISILYLPFYLFRQMDSLLLHHSFIHERDYTIGVIWVRKSLWNSVETTFFSVISRLRLYFFVCHDDDDDDGRHCVFTMPIWHLKLLWARTICEWTRA